MTTKKEKLLFKEMTRSKKQMNDQDALNLLINGRFGVLGTISDNGYPYTTPMNYVYFDNKIYFHSAKIGHKIDNINQNEKVSFTVIGEESIIEEELTSHYKSVTLFGRAKVIPGNKDILFSLVKKYAMKMFDESKQSIEEDYHHTSIIEITIEHMTGKESD
ncbi:MAG: pyridoxamine 5'-phosphate oxidase family protein [Acholeplasmataceae bacterium]|nr:pyridoxamine 5'-phosphate oxidase family protein [Acholeplasmataceae bacterium]